METTIYNEDSRVITLKIWSLVTEFLGDSGIYVSKIRKHGAADRAGLEIGDKIISVKVYKLFFKFLNKFIIFF